MYLYTSLLYRLANIDKVTTLQTFKFRNTYNINEIILLIWYIALNMYENITISSCRQ